MSKIPEHLVEKIQSIPAKPGIYQMKDIEGNVMYIGKSKSLQSRVKSYFYADHKQRKIERMVFHIHDIDVIITDTHLEAQILECELIKKMKPIYNKQFKNDRNYVFLKIEDDNRSKPLSIVSEKENTHCIGPYRSKNRLLESIKYFQNIYPIIKCEQGYDFTYHVLPQELDQRAFERNKESLVEILLDKECMKTFASQITEMMEDAASQLQFETASTYRGLLADSTYLQTYDAKENRTRDRKILMGEKIEDGYKFFYISANRIIRKKKYKQLRKDRIEGFLRKAQEVEQRECRGIDEKGHIDYERIISKEVQEEESKGILFVDESYCMEALIRKLKHRK